MSDDTTTTDEVVETPASEETQPEETINQTAESSRSDEQPTPEAKEEEPVKDNSDENAELLEWARKKGLNPEDPASILRAAREAEKGFHEKAKESSELKKKVQANSGDETESETLLNEMRINNFYAEKPEARALDGEMAKIFLSYQESQPEFAHYLKKNISVLYDLARANASDTEIQTARQKGKQEALKSTAQSQASSAPKTNATNQAQPRGLTQERINQIIAEGKYAQHREEILAWEKENTNL